MNNKDKSLLSDLQYFLDNDSRLIASASGRRIYAECVSDSNGNNWRVIFKVRFDNQSRTFDSLSLSEAVDAFNNF